MSTLRLIRLLLTLALLTLFSATALAQPAEDSAALEADNLESLVETLESDTGREQLLQDLRALLELQEQQQAEEEPANELVSAVQLDKVTQSLQQQYKDFLERRGLNASLVGHLLVSGAIILITLLLLYILRRVIALLHKRLAFVTRHYQISGRRLGFYTSALRICGSILILSAAVVALLTLWGLDADRWIPHQTQIALLQAVLSVAVIFAVGAVVIETTNALVEGFFRRRLSHNQARMNTLMPIAQTVLLLSLFTLFGLTLLSQLGLDVMPLLAGAGVVGFAVGFGAQTLIKDVLNGFIIIVEDLIQVGDVVNIDGKGGLVEKITVRKVQLRGLDGTVFTVPFSEVTVVENLTKDFSYYLLDVRVAYREDTDQVIEVLREVEEQMRQEEPYRDVILEPLEVLGVDKLTENAVIIKARIKTIPLQQWTVGREFNRRMKRAFDAHNIEIPFPHHTLHFGQHKEGSAPPAPVRLLANSGDENDCGAAGDTAGNSQDSESQP